MDAATTYIGVKDEVDWLVLTLALELLDSFVQTVEVSDDGREHDGLALHDSIVGCRVDGRQGQHGNRRSRRSKPPDLTEATARDCRQEERKRDVKSADTLSLSLTLLHSLSPIEHLPAASRVVTVYVATGLLESGSSA